MRTGPILDSRRTRQQVALQKFALLVKARFNPSRDSAGCTIVMRWQRRLKSYFSDDQTPFLVTRPRHSQRFLRASFAGRQISCNPKPKSLHQVERNPFNAGCNDLANYTGARSLNPRNTGRKVGYVRVRVDELARREDPCRKNE